MYRVAFLLILIICAPAFAQTNATNLTGVIGDYGSETGTRGAVTNRRIADQLYKQSLEDERNAWKSFPPNVSLLSRALANSKDAKTADDQAKEFARAALHGLNSGSHSGKFDAAAHGMVSQEQLKDLATKSSPLRPQVEQTLNSYSGMKLDADKMVLKTPFGDISVDVSRETMLTAMKGAALALGYNPEDVQRGVEDAARLRDAIAAKAAKEVDAEMQAAKKLAADTNKAGDGPGTAAAAVADAQQAGDGSEAQNDGSRDPAAAIAGIDKDGVDWDAKQREFQRNQEAIRRQLGMTVQSSNGDPIGTKDQDLFQMVHRKYQNMRGEGVFIETMEPVAAAVTPSRKK
jgi:hypothetical protein